MLVKTDMDTMEAQKRIAATVRDYLARERISREQLSFRTRLGKSTIDKLLIGLFSDRTLSIVEKHTKLPLRSMLEPGAVSPSAEDADAPAARMNDLPSIAVMPFTNLGGDQSQDFIADGISEDIITALAR